MKTKIKDLTLEEKEKLFCAKYDECRDCPLAVGPDWDYVYQCVVSLANEEVEVDE